MSLFPNIFDMSSYNTMLAQHQPLSSDHEHTAHIHHSFIDSHHISEMVVDILSRMLAPASYLQCTSTIPCWAPSTTDVCTAEKKSKIIVDDDYALLDEEEEDGGPLCRETTIASWKARPAKKERNRSIQWLASVVRTDSH
jgi:hypothetical protein